MSVLDVMGHNQTLQEALRFQAEILGLQATLSVQDEVDHKSTNMGIHVPELLGHDQTIQEALKFQEELLSLQENLQEQEEVVIVNKESSNMDIPVVQSMEQDQTIQEALKFQQELLTLQKTLGGQGYLGTSAGETNKTENEFNMFPITDPNQCLLNMNMEPMPELFLTNYLPSNNSNEIYRVEQIFEPEAVNQCEDDVIAYGAPDYIAIDRDLEALEQEVVENLYGGDDINSKAHTNKLQNRQTNAKDQQTDKHIDALEQEIVENLYGGLNLNTKPNAKKLQIRKTNAKNQRTKFLQDEADRSNLFEKITIRKVSEEIHNPLHIKEEPSDISYEAPNNHTTNEEKNAPLLKPDTSYKKKLKIKSTAEINESVVSKHKLLYESHVDPTMFNLSLPETVGIKVENSNETNVAKVKKTRRGGGRTFLFCHVCSKSFKQKSHIRRHMIDNHIGNTEARVPCGLCKKTFARRASLKVHMAIHNGDARFSCSICSKAFNQKSNLKVHMDTHLGVRYPCKLCDQSFSAKSTLTDHMLKHTGATFSCHICSKTFTTKFILRSHVRDHENLKFPCDECSSQFSRKANLVKHKGSVHGGVKYRCDQCDKVFSQASNLRTHKKWHRGIKYRCDLCSIEYSTYGYLQRHQQQAHGSLGYACTLCDRKFPARWNLIKHYKSSHALDWDMNVEI